MQNPSNDLNPSEQKLREALEQVEVSERISPQPEWMGTHSVKTPLVRPSQIAINTDINAEALSAQISEDVTILQVASPFPKAEAGNDNTILQGLPNPSPQDYPFSVVLVDHVSLSPQKPGVVERIGSSSQPTQTVEPVSLTPNLIAQFSLENDSKNLNTAGVAVIQNHDNTIVQYSDSAIHNPADRTVYQAMRPLSTELDQTVFQLRMPQSSVLMPAEIVSKNRAHVQLFHPSIFRDIFRTSSSFTSRFISFTGQFFDSIWRKIDLKQLQSRFHLGREQAVVKTLEQASSSRINRSTHNVMVSEEPPSPEQYQKKLRELDLCRLSFAKELARNGKFRNARALAEQISETSHFFKDAQMLIQSWK
ncbi:hypothetical protein [Nostoc sp. 'Lobaria pulmonaria (5183) cyanobiont']|uniref:hypothetical protein n=1 Tax=Nostoc sp. 'Lobaria pulmonaria (5183) cyanobiont' TaxID=1618022 RepID=UPI000CF30F57|nr:hypothetical protein [Nostoc sp. 'Lobaria pulmonaria (5183) cyanobiont']AVH71532.1 hypothetical protein NLP_2936 [Nostoc sp. 'Lobaria pulmonaria (5183) cyanobiont']